MSVVALRNPQPRIDAVTVAKMTFLPRGRFEAFGDGGRWMQGKLLVNAIPAWATRLHLNGEDFSALTEVVAPDD